MNYSNLRSQIFAAIKYPPKISAASLQEQLINIVNGLDLGALLLGVATPSLTPHTEANGFYFALQSGTYTNFPTINGQTITVDSSEVAIIVRSGSYWSKIHITTYPTIDPKTKHWMIGNEDTGVLAEGTTPHIDQESGNWMIGTYDTGIHAQGAPGKDAYQPFKGSFSSVQDLNAAYPEPNDGDTAYVEDTVENTTVLKVYDVVNGEWHDTGTTADSPVFGSGQLLSSVKIDDTHLANPADGSLPKAEDVMQLKAKLEGVMDEETRKEYDVPAANENHRVLGSTGLIDASTLANWCEISVVGARMVRFLGIAFKSSIAQSLSDFGYACGHYENGVWVTDICKQYDTNTEDVNVTREYRISVPLISTHFRTNCKYGSMLLNASNFYIYLTNGESVGRSLERIENEIVEQPSNLSLHPTDNVQIQFKDYVINDWCISVNPSFPWYNGDCMCAIIPVRGGDKIHIASLGNDSVHYGFFENYPTPVSGQPAELIGYTLYYINTSGFPEKERTAEIPSNARYVYFRIQQGKAYYIPKAVTIIPSGIAASKNYYPTDYNTYIEEDYVRRTTTAQSSGEWVSKDYKIDKTSEYKVILPISANQNYSFAYLDSNGDVIDGQTYWGGNSSELQFKVMVDLPDAIPDNAEFIRLIYYSIQRSGKYTNDGSGALMKPLRYDGSIPTNDNIYCVSRIKIPPIPNGYSAGNGDSTNPDIVTFEQENVWSAWSFMLPKKRPSTLSGKPIPLVSFFHGSTGFVTSDVMGYNSANTKDSFVDKLRDKGFCVFDINGYGVSNYDDNLSRHYGNAASVLTAKKAYEILTERFNCRKGMVMAGISMGGSLAKHYCMLYPNDVIAAALEAPSDNGLAVRTNASGLSGGTYQAWGYANEDEWNADTEKERFIGCSPTIRPFVVAQDGIIRKMEGNEFTVNDVLSNDSIDNFVGAFQVEIKIWQGTMDNSVDPRSAQWFVNTVRNAGGNASIRVCPNCGHSLNSYPNVVSEIISYIEDKIGL